MPIFEFYCKKCDKKFETLVISGSDSERICCPSCKSKKVIKLMSAFAGGKSSCTSCAATSCAPS